MTAIIRAPETYLDFMIMAYLKSTGKMESFLTMEKETNMSLEVLCREIHFFKHTLVEGKFAQAKNLLQIFFVNNKEEYEKFVIIIEKQRLLELIESCRTKHDSNYLVTEISKLEELSKADHQKLCDLLAFKSISEHPEFSEWTPLKGRYECFKAILPSLGAIYHTDNRPNGDINREFDYLKCFKGLVASLEKSLAKKSTMIFLETFLERKSKKVKFVKDSKKKESLDSDQFMRLVNSKATLCMKNLDSVSDNIFCTSFDDSKQEHESLVNLKFDNPKENSLDSNYLKETLNLREKKRQEMIMKYSLEYQTQVEKQTKARQKCFSIKCINNENLRKIELSEVATGKLESTIKSRVLEKGDTSSSKLISFDQYSCLKQIDDDIISHKQSPFVKKLDLDISILTEKVDFETTKKRLEFGVDDTKRDRNSTVPKLVVERRKSHHQVVQRTPPGSNFELIYEGCDTLPVRAASFSKNGNHLIVGSNSGILNLYNLQNIVKNYVDKGSDKFDLNHGSFNPLKNMIYSCEEFAQDPIYTVETSRETGFVAVGSVKGRTKLFKILKEESDDLISLDCLQSFEKMGGRVRSVDFSYDSTKLISSGQDSKINCYDLHSGKTIAQYTSEGDNIHIAKYAYGFNSIISISPHTNSMTVWDSRIRGDKPITGHKSINRFKNLDSKYDLSPPTAINFDNRGSHLSNNMLAIGHEEGEISLWDIQRVIGQPDASFPSKVIKGLHFDAVRDVNFSFYNLQMSKYSLISGSFDSRIKIWDITLQQETILNDPFDVDVDIIQTLSDHQDRVVSSIWHSELPVIVTTSADCTFKIYCDSQYLDDLC